MIIKLLFAIGLLIVLFWYINKIKNLPAQQKKKAIYKVVTLGLATILLLGVITGRMHWFGAVIAGLLPLMKVGFTTFTRLIPIWMNHTGGLASFKTEHLDAKVHIQQGTVTGTIIKGLFEGRPIDSLSSDELTKLEEYYKGMDTKSYYIIRYKQKKSSNYSNEQESQAPMFATPNREEALLILGLNKNPTKEEITNAHRRLINRVHPDKGGNDFLASRINQARDVLLSKK